MSCKHTLLIGLGAVLGMAGSAGAAAFNFATFNEVSGARPFTFTNITTGGTLSYNSSVPVLFDFTAPTGLSTADRPATLTISATANSPATLSGGILDQPIAGAVAPDVLTIVENSTGKTLLHMAFSGDLIGKNSDVSALLSGNDALGNTVTFSSDYLTFNAPGNSYDLSPLGDQPRIRELEPAVS